MLSAVGGLTLEIIEGPGAGQKSALDRALVIGRAQDADVIVEDDQVSRHHARVSPAQDGSAVVEDLGSANGTFVNHNQLHGPARLDPTDHLLLGVTVMELRTDAQIHARPTAQRTVPPALAQAPREPDYVRAAAIDLPDVAEPPSPGLQNLQRYLDVRVRRQAELAPLALLMLIALALSIYFATR
jgi:predicted component of type VI protein secretion system